MDTSQTFKEKMSVDIIGDLRLPLLMIVPFISLFFLMVLGLESPIFDIVYILIWYLCFIALILQDIVTVEVNKEAITIHRYISSPAIIKIEDIVKIKGRNNISEKYHTLLNLIMLLGLIASSYFAYSNTLRVLDSNMPLVNFIFLILSNSIIIVFLLILFFNAEKRFKYSGFLEIKTNDGKFRFFTQHPDEFREILITELQEPA